jgi:hypothetical protein
MKNRVVTKNHVAFKIGNLRTYFQANPYKSENRSFQHEKF